MFGHPITDEDLERYTELVSELPLVMGCGKRCRKLLPEVKESAPSAELVTGSIRGYTVNEDGEKMEVPEPHYWIEVLGIDIDGYARDDETAVIDPSLNQFTRENFESGDVNVWIPCAEDANEITIIPESDQRHRHYQ